MAPIEKRLKITEIFLSLQGEANDSGWPSVFVRLTGCPLRCSYCDSEYAFTGGEWFGFDEIIKIIKSHAVKHVCITGGEPLSQKSVHSLLSKLCDLDYKVSLETSGALSIKDVDQRVAKVVDVKTPSSDESDKNDLENLTFLNKKDQLKFLIGSDEDYQWSKAFIQKHQCQSLCTVLFSPVYQKISDLELANNIINDKLDVRFQMQLHKYLWGDKIGV